MTVVILEDATEDLESGVQFCESWATGVGDYFLDSILSDLDSLVLVAGVHPIIFNSTECYRSDSLSASITRWKMTHSTFMRFWICGTPLDSETFADKKINGLS